MNRNQRRAIQKLQSKPSNKASGNLQTALKALDQIKDLEQVATVVKDVQKQVQEAQQVLDALVGDYQNLSDEMELQREVTLRLIWRAKLVPDISLDGLRGVEAEVRAQLKQEDT
jgi:hypothetical protein